MAAKDLVQLRVMKPGNHFIPEGYVRGPKGLRKGDPFWTKRENATNKQKNGYVDSGFAEPIGAGGAQAAAPGPQEKTLGGPAEKKSSGAVPAGLSTDSPKSPEGGTVQQSFLSGADRLSTQGKSGSSKAGDGGAKTGE